jgi:hypothetical protein
MITIRQAQQRGKTELAWLRSSHSFSFGDYLDPDFMGFRSLRVINEDIVAPGAGFGMHSHRDMEIVTLVLSGALEHRDSLGSGSVIRPGMVQRMTAGRGIKHSEFNHSKTDPVHFLQIWVEPLRRGLDPSYQDSELRFLDGIACVASPTAAAAAVTIHQDVRMSLWRMPAGSERLLTIAPRRCGWLQVTTGSAVIGASGIGAGDGAAIVDEQALPVQARSDAEILVFDLA